MDDQSEREQPQEYLSKMPTTSSSVENSNSNEMVESSAGNNDGTPLPSPTGDGKPEAAAAAPAPGEPASTVADSPTAEQPGQEENGDNATTASIPTTPAVDNTDNNNTNTNNESNTDTAATPAPGDGVAASTSEEANDVAPSTSDTANGNPVSDDKPGEVASQSDATAPTRTSPTPASTIAAGENADATSKDTMADAAGENNGVDEDRDNKPESVASPAPAPSATAALLAAASTDDGTASPQGSATPGPGTPSVIMAPGTPDSGSAGGTPRTGRMTNQLQYISKVILPTLNKHPSAWPFKKPVDWKKLGLLSYPEIIANPMDLGTIRNKLRKKEYFSGRECLDDIELVWHNCQTFNRPSDDVYIMSQALESDYKQMLANLPEPEVPLDRPSAKAKSAQAIKAAPALIVPSLPTHRRQSSRVIRAPKDGLLAASSRLPAHMRVCYDIIKDLFGKKHQAYAWPFYEPVDIVKLNIPDYYDVIKQPMDLGTVRTKLEEGEYETRDDFAHDVRLVFANCYTYNPPGSDVVKMAKSTSEVFELQWAALDAPAPATPAPTSAKSSSVAATAGSGASASGTGASNKSHAAASSTSKLNHAGTSAATMASRTNSHTASPKTPAAASGTPPAKQAKQAKAGSSSSSSKAKASKGKQAPAKQSKATAASSSSKRRSKGSAAKPTRVVTDSTSDSSDSSDEDDEQLKLQQVQQLTQSIVLAHQQLLQLQGGGALPGLLSGFPGLGNMMKPKKKKKKKAKKAPKRKHVETEDEDEEEEEEYQEPTPEKKKPAPKKPAKKRAKAPPKKAPPKSTPAPAPAPATTAVPTTLHHHDDDDEDGHSSGDEAQLPMTWDEKKILSQNINLLPSDCVPEIVNIVQSHEPNVGGDANDEFELDFDKLSTRTLRALDRYVRSNLPASDATVPPRLVDDDAVTPVVKSEGAWESDDDDDDAVAGGSTAGQPELDEEFERFQEHKAAEKRRAAELREAEARLREEQEQRKAEQRQQALQAEQRRREQQQLQKEQEAAEEAKRLEAERAAREEERLAAIAAAEQMQSHMETEADVGGDDDEDDFLDD